MTTTEISQDSKNFALLAWLGTFIFGFIPALVLYLVKKEDEFVVAHSKAVLNWCITFFIASLVAGILSFVIIGIFIFPVIMIANLVFCVMGAVKASKAEDYMTPMTFRIIK